MRNNSSNTSRKASLGRGERRSTSSNSSSKSRKGKSSPGPAAKAQLIKLGVDVHTDTYTFTRMVDDSLPQPAQTMSPQDFLRYVVKQKTLAHRVVVAYEVGCFGFTLARQLLQRQIECLPMAPTALDNNGKGKTDRLDSGAITSRLDRYLAGNQRAMTVVRIPSLQEELARDQARERDQFKRDRQRFLLRGRSLLCKYGVHHVGRWWSESRMQQIQKDLQALYEPAQAQQILSQLNDYIEAITMLALREQVLTQELEAASRQKNEQRPKGIGHLSLELIGREICDWNRFENRRQVASYTGLCPGRFESGGRGYDLSINKHGNPRLRGLLVELAWMLPRLQPGYKRLEKWKWLFQEQTPGSRRKLAGCKKKAIVALARHLAIDLWRLSTGRATAEQLGLTVVSG